jgi:hypothetical protein
MPELSGQFFALLNYTTAIFKESAKIDNVEFIQGAENQMGFVGLFAMLASIPP